MPNAPAHATRTVRVPDDIWIAARSAATTAGESVASVVVRALQAYAANPPSTPVIQALPCEVCGKVVKRKGGGGIAPADHKDYDGLWCV